MSPIEADVVAALRGRPDGMTLGELRRWLADRGVQTAPGQLEAVLLLSGRVVERDGRWRRGELSRGEAILEALDRYAEESGRSLFKAESALQALPRDLLPSQEELVSVLLQSDRFELLKNNMVRKRGA